MRGQSRHAAAVALALILIGLNAGHALAWNAATHRAITVLALGAIPPGPLKNALTAHLSELEYRAVEPDKLREIYGKVEGRRHYIDLEMYGDDPFAVLVPDESAMIQRFGIYRFNKAGTLPWTIEEVAADLDSAWRDSDCAAVVVLAGHLSHYVGDASQPLHTTLHFEGYAGDESMHERLEETVDRQIGALESAARPRVRVVTLDSVWPIVIAELRESHALLPDVVAADRAARIAGPNPVQFDTALMDRERGLIVNQLADAASVLASVWLFEWNQAGKPSVCQQR